MSSELLLSNIIPFAGSDPCGLCYRFCFEKDLEVDTNYRRFPGYVSTVNWDKLGNDTSTQMQHWATNADITNLHGLSLGIPVSSGLALGLLAGFVRTM